MSVQRLLTYRLGDVEVLNAVGDVPSRKGNSFLVTTRQHTS